MFKDLDHIGYVVRSILESVVGFSKHLGVIWSRKVYRDIQQEVNVTFITQGIGKTLIELVEPIGNDSPVKRFLDKTSGGLHHLCYTVDRLNESLNFYRNCGCLIVKEPEFAKAFKGRRVAWIMTPEMLLIELLEL